MKPVINSFTNAAMAFATLLLVGSLPSPANAATINLSAGGNLNLAIEQALPGDTILLAPGTYTPQATPFISGAPFSNAFWITKNVTIRGTSGAATTILDSNGGFEYAVQFRSIGYLNGPSNPSGAILDGVTVTSLRGGVIALDNSVPGGLQNIQIRNVVVNADGNNVNAESGVLLQKTTDSIVDNVVVNKGALGGIYLLDASRNIVMNSVVNRVRIQHAITSFGGAYNQILNNTITQSPLEGIAIKNSSFARVEGNTISGYFSDGIALSDNSRNSAVIHNTMVADAYRYSPLIANNINRANGVGLWLNCGSNANYVAGNYLRGAPEVGLAIYSSNNNYILGNVVTENLQGGVLTRDLTQFCDPNIASSKAADNNIIHRNSTTYQEQGGGILAIQSSANEIAYNYVSSINEFGQKVTRPLGTFGLSFFSALQSKVFANTVNDTTYPVNVDINTFNTQFFRNRFLKNGTGMIVRSPASTRVDDELAVGGNHWDVANIGGNPNPNTTPYKDIIVINAADVVQPSGTMQDRYPYGLETFGRTYDASIKYPASGAVIANGRRARIEWHSDACTFVNIVYNAGGPSAIVVATKVPNTGYYTWTLPNLPAGNGYIAGVECLTGSGLSTGVFRYSLPFAVANSSLVLMSPHGVHLADAGSTMRVAWRKTDPSALVSVFLSYNGGAETLVASSATNPFADFILPNITTNTARIRVSSPTGQDGTDGYFSIRRGGATGQITSVVANQNLQIGFVHDLRWASVAGSTIVDLEYFDGAVFKPIVRNFADRGSYSWLVQEAATNDSRLRILFKDQNGTTLSSAESATVNIVYRTDVGVLQNRFRLFNINTLEHLYTSDLNEFTVLKGYSDWLNDFSDRPAMRTFSGPNIIGGVKLRPYYRLFNKVTRIHHWTISREDYFVKRTTPATWEQEGVDGYVLPTQVAGTVPLYRIFFPPLNKYLWTVDANEYNYQVTVGGWTNAGVPGLPLGVEGYVYAPL